MWWKSKLYEIILLYFNIYKCKKKKVLDTMVFTKSNIGYVLLVSKDYDGIYDIYDDREMDLKTYKDDERIRISEMGKHIGHKSDFKITNFPVEPRNMSNYYFVFFKNEVDNGFLSIDEKTFYKPSIFVVEFHTRNEFVDNLVLNQYDYDISDLNNIRFILHKAPPDCDGLQNNPELLSLLKEYLIEVKDDEQN